MLIGVVSDTHGHVDYTREAVRMLESLEVELVIHCGDIGSVMIPPLFQQWPAHYVFGNVDTAVDALRESIEETGHTCHGRFGELELEGVRIAILHSDDARLFQQTIDSGDWDLVCYGHTHVAESHRAGQVAVLNPGAIFRANPRSVAVVDLPSLRITPVPL